jgi:hypothetical protein
MHALGSTPDSQPACFIVNFCLGSQVMNIIVAVVTEAYTKVTLFGR